jgi:hypothetical protein
MIMVTGLSVTDDLVEDRAPSWRPRVDHHDAAAVVGGGGSAAAPMAQRCP